MCARSKAHFTLIFDFGSDVTGFPIRLHIATVIIILALALLLISVVGNEATGRLPLQRIL